MAANPAPTTNGNHNRRLQVVIVGGGLGGLSVGLLLREFADVTILESAAILSEIGAAVQIAPNSHRILKAHGCDLMVDGDGNLTSALKVDAKEMSGIEWAQCHRGDLQTEIYKHAVDPNGPGTPCKVICGARVTSADAENASVTLANGDVYHGDLLIGADGLRSVVRRAVVSEDAKSTPSGYSAYRGLLRAEKIRSIPEVEKMKLLEEQLAIVYGKDQRIITYATRGGSVLNFAAMIRQSISYVERSPLMATADSEMNEISEARWTAPGSTAALVKSFSSFPKAWQDLLSLSEEDELRVYQLRDQFAMDHWVKGRAIIIGDAAHACLPYQGQGASQAVEDAEALATYLRGVGPEGVHDALIKVFKVRYKRATYAQEISRKTGLYKHKGDEPEPPYKVLDPNEPIDKAGILAFFWDYHGAADWVKRKPEWILE
ncbi:3-hydroxybenzoate 6-hydroxylase 1 [Vanrija pseudolonga]|uniref:3-hydroxybenzoate 6-hydroxylase 1 n=1 Tax=Vanrija pseudolonga TaxID=143232 RepID=A0AAF1BFL3_9TREE|nr:3-hydroxybenzoate 6-hydroxylase 1 [Vanrija pseudolonga]